MNCSHFYLRPSEARRTHFARVHYTATCALLAVIEYILSILIKLSKKLSVCRKTVRTSKSGGLESDVVLTECEAAIRLIA